MAEIKSFLGSDAQKDILAYITNLEKIADNYKTIASESLKLEKAKQEEQKTEQSLIKTQQQAEILTQKRIKNDAELFKKEQQLQKALQQKAIAEDKKLKTDKTALDLSIKKKKAKQEEQKTEQSLIKTQQQAEILTQKRIKTQKDEITLTEKIATKTRKVAAAVEKENSSYQKLNTAHKNAIKNARELAAKYGVLDKRAKAAAKTANRLGTELKKVNNTTGQANSTNVGKYTSSIIKAGAAMAVASLSFRAVFNVFKSSIKTIANFEEAMSKVRAVTGAMPKEFKALSNNAKLLGSTTSKTATQVAGLQLEFSKLGFSTQEILAATEATISLSIAAGSDLAESAVVAASTIRGFGLDASET